MRKKLIIKNDINELNKVEPFAEELASYSACYQGLAFKLVLILDEILCNIISYAYKDKEEHFIEVEVLLEEKEVKMNITDDGIAFNPLELPEPDIEKPLEERPIGGLGVHIVKNTVKEINYKRIDNKNILSMTIATD